MGAENRGFSQKTADFHADSPLLETAENRRKPQILLRHLRSVTFSYSREGDVTKQKSARVARLQNEVGTKAFFFEARICSHEKCSEIFPKFFEPSFVDQKKSRKIPAKFPAKFPKQKIKKDSPTSFCRRAGRKISDKMRLSLNEGKAFSEGMAWKGIL